MVELSISLSDTIALAELLLKIADAVRQAWVAHMNRKKASDRILEDGSRFISIIEDGKVGAFYYHATKKHSATAQGGIGGGGQVRCIAPPGEWAVAITDLGIKGAKTFYNSDL